MDLTYGAEYESFRQQVRTFVERAWLPHAKLVKAGRKAAEAAFRRESIEQGYLYRAIPRQYGGSEQAPDVMRGQIIREEFGRVRAPMEVPGVGVGMLVPTLLECGTQEQKDRFIAKTLTGEYLWAQGYSEPNAGSDLASVRTKGVLQDGEWVINGQKVWSTFAQYARFMFALVRTEPEAPKHQGLSYILLDLKQPGVTVRPLKQVTGGEEFCEVFFDDARAPADWIVGERGKGWQVSKTTLVHERSSFIGNASSSQALYDKLVDLARGTSLNGKPAIDDPLIRERLLVLEGYVASHVYSSYRQFSMTAHGQHSGIVVEKTLDGALELDLFRGQEKIHGQLPASCPLSRGSPRPRSAMMLRWMFEAPPAMATPRAPKNWLFHFSGPAPRVPSGGGARSRSSPIRSRASLATSWPIWVEISLFIEPTMPECWPWAVMENCR